MNYLGRPVTHIEVIVVIGIYIVIRLLMAFTRGLWQGVKEE